VQGGAGVLGYTWSVTRGATVIAFKYEQPNHSQISFVAPVAGPYNVEVDINSLNACSPGIATLNVMAPNAQFTDYRLRVTAAPRHLTWAAATTTLAVDAGSAVSGVVTDAANAAVAGAKVQLAIAGVPSTLTTTAADGSFTVRAVAQTGASVAVEVVPPAGRGL